MIIKDSPYFDQVRLLLQVLPYVLKEKCFALKGGTAINLFFRDMPRFSVDIDLTYLPIEAREVSLGNIQAALGRIASDIKKHLPDVQSQEMQLMKPEMISKLFVRRPGAQIKIEPNLVIRGSVFPPEEHVLCPRAQKVFEMFMAARTMSFPDVFGGKICAALDRQHPRDLYDVKLLLENEGVTEQVRKGFIIYLISHDRPMSELVAPVKQDIKKIFEAEFRGMDNDPVSYEDLVKTRDRLVNILKQDISRDEKEFLVSFKSADPNWNLLGVQGVEYLPAVRWKLMNIGRMGVAKRESSIARLRAALDM